METEAVFIVAYVRKKQTDRNIARIKGMSDSVNRQSIRLRGYDYSTPGYYFVTICVNKRSGPVLCEIFDGLTEFGRIVQYTWNDLPNHVNGIVLDECIVMPDHVHFVIRLTKDESGKITLHEIVRQFKTFSSIRINRVRNSSGVPVWQRGYYEHIIRDARSLTAIRVYIRMNPLKLRDCT